MDKMDKMDKMDDVSMEICKLIEKNIVNYKISYNRVESILNTLYKNRNDFSENVFNVYIDLNKKRVNIREWSICYLNNHNIYQTCRTYYGLHSFFLVNKIDVKKDAFIYIIEQYM